MMIARRCCCSAISVLFQTTRPRSVLVSQHKQKNSSLLSSIDRSHFFFVFFFERFFLYQNREDCVAKAVLFFSSFQEKLLRKMDRFVCSRPKKKNFRLQICPRGLPSSSRQPRIQNQRKLVRVCGIKFQFSLPLHKIKTLLKEYSLIHARAPHHKKETSSGDAPPFDLLKPFRVLIDTGE
jgi:hypothetical protein